MMSQRVKAGLLIFSLCLTAAHRLPAQDHKTGSPSFVVQQFYKLLRAKRYAEGFRHSIYSLALEGLSADELRELEPDFERIATALPEQVEIRGEEISGDKATVFVKLPNETQAQEVGLIKVASQWIIGDRETQKLLKNQGRNYFFNERIRVSEAEANEWLQEILGAQLVFFKAKQRYTALDELIKLGGVSPLLANGAVNGYRFAIVPSKDGQSFVVTAIPVTYGRTGRLSFYADQTNLIRAEDKNGQPATASAAPYAPSKN
jgi:hypothetical protein